MTYEEKLEKKIDIILERIGSIDCTLAAQSVSLHEHMRRSDHLEKYIGLVKKEVDYTSKSVYNIQGGVRVAMSIGAVVGGLIMLLRIIKGGM